MIHEQAFKIGIARQKMEADLMREYDEKIYFPMLHELRERCELLGHSPTGHVLRKYEYCSACGVLLK